MQFVSFLYWSMIAMICFDHNVQYLLLDSYHQQQKQKPTLNNPVGTEVGWQNKWEDTVIFIRIKCHII